jgi:mono/diheme cytochrome c family protein
VTFGGFLSGWRSGVILLQASPASAVPSFARRYQTSCQTCHTIFPKLNPFGQAFRLNGSFMPMETAEQVKQKPVSLGAESYERMWPEMVFPSDLPGNVPFALNTKK